MQQLTQLLEIELTTPNRIAICETIVEQANEGNIDVLKVHAQLKCFEDLLTRLTDTKKYPIMATSYRRSIIAAADTYGKSFELHAGKFETKEAGVKYDYSQCNDPVMTDLHARQAALDAEVKAREKFLQSVPEKGLVVTDETTGETNTIYRPSKTSTTTLQLTLK